jgi:hypothetical protein
MIDSTTKKIMFIYKVVQVKIWVSISKKVFFFALD